ncbi:hypothetical protein Q3G72_027845 [Acer saccharum]|nr:hypothetical protein Q3G72_027845 [Acer saccharum]
MTTKCSSDARRKEISSSKLTDSIKIGPWGGPGGNQHWSFKAKVAITEIIITHGIVVDSISFTSIDENGKIEHSEKFGGGGGKTEKVLFDWPGEYLTSISGTCNIFYGNYVVQSLCFYTNQTRYGPFGCTSGSPFNFPMEDGVIIGFHGRGWPSFGYVDAIGIYIKPVDDLFCGSTQGVLSITNKPHISLSDLRFFSLSLNSITSSHGLSLFRHFINQSTHWKSLFRLQSSLFHGFDFRLQSSLFKESSSKLADSIKIGPWGGPGGNQHWSFKAKVAITEIIITHGMVVDSVSFTSIDENGKIEHSEKFGGGGGKTEKVLLDWPREYLTSISGTCNIFYGNYVVQSLCFYTNQTRYGPFGCTSGSPFNFPMEDGVIIGFHGHDWPSFGYVDAIGVYVKPFEDLFCGSIQGVLSITNKDPSYNWKNPTKKDLWGGNGGKEWNYQPNGAITEIKVRHGKCIDSISFKSKDGDGNWRKYGGTGGKEEPPFQIDWPRDYLASIRGTYNYSDENKLVIQSLYFETRKGLPYGPFGEADDKEAKKFEFSMGEWIIVGLFGRESTLIDALGHGHENTKGKFLSLYLQPLAETRKIHLIAKLRVLVPHGVKSFEKTLTHQFEPLPESGFGYREFMPLTDLYEASNEYLKDGTLTVQENSSNLASNSIKVGPWGGPGGDQHWSFKAKVAITEIIICNGWVVDSVSFVGIDENGEIYYSKKYGGDRGEAHKISLDWPREFLTYLSGTCHDHEGNYGIQSLCFHTNRTKYGPYGRTNGSPFNFPMENGVIIGFYGRAGCSYASFVNAIGVYAKPLEDSFCDSTQGLFITHKVLGSGSGMVMF